MTKLDLVTREELYELVWEIPVARLAKEFDVSDVGLAKVCSSLGIPRPARGYWQKLERGHPVERQPLRPLASPRVPDLETVTLHPVISKLRAQSQAVAPQQLRGRVEYGTRAQRLDIVATKETLQRSIYILNELSVSLEGRGFSLDVVRYSGTMWDSGRFYTAAIRASDWIGVQIRELPSDRSNQRRLILTLRHPTKEGVIGEWRDSLFSLLDDSLRGVVPVIEQHLPTLRKERIAREHEAAAFEATKRGRVRRKRDRLQIERQVTAWTRATDVRLYADALERTLETAKSGERAALAGWIQRVREYAAFLDPIQAKWWDGDSPAWVNNLQRRCPQDPLEFYALSESGD